MSTPEAGDTLVVSEIFGPTVQGEGPTAGRRASFVRLGRCDLSCRWCDTPYTWDWDGVTGTRYDPAQELSRRPIADVVDDIVARGSSRIVLTGGEPLLQRRGLTALVAALDGVVDGLAVEVETNGRHRPLHAPGVSIAHNVSPKLASSGDPTDARIVPAALAALRDAGANFKFVVGSVADLDEVAGIVAANGIADDAVWISPLGRDAQTVVAVQRAVSDAVIERGWNLSTRLHVLSWGDERGR